VINRRAATVPDGALPDGHVHAALAGRDASRVTRGVISGRFGDLAGFATTATHLARAARPRPRSRGDGARRG
jgi:hypothetical protein